MTEEQKRCIDIACQYLHYVAAREIDALNYLLRQRARLVPLVAGSAFCFYPWDGAASANALAAMRDLDAVESACRSARARED